MEHPKKTYYPKYDVLEQFHEWDAYTQQVIQQRLSQSDVSFFSEQEKMLLLAIYPILFPSHLGEIKTNVIEIVDQRIQHGDIQGFVKGTRHQKVDVIKGGLQNIFEHTYTLWHKPFSQLKKEQQIAFIENLRNNQGFLNIWEEYSPQLFFKTLMQELIPIVYSDPNIWSRIGYGGPAYPRGYYAFGPNQFDSREAEIHD